MNILLFVIVATLAVIALAVGVDAGRSVITERKARRKAAEEANLRYAKWALHTLTVANLRRNAVAVYHRPHGTHRRIRTY